MVKAKITSSLIKAFADENIEKYSTLEKISALKGESLSFEFLYTFIEEPTKFYRRTAKISVSGDLSKYVRLYNIKHMPADVPVTPDMVDEGYLRTAPGIYPDMLMPISEISMIYLRHLELCSLWIDIDIPTDAPVGISELKLTISSLEGEVLAESSVNIEVIDAVLPEQKLKFTQWFYADCLASYYDVPIWSEEHWNIIEKFAVKAVSGGINMLLTPVFTPPLDTYIGGERPTTQLVGVTLKNGEYSFDFSLLDRWVDMCDRVGIKHLEISHLFTQWGALHAPKVMATFDGEYKKIFGWETDAHGEEYTKFLRDFLIAFLAHMTERGDDKRCFFHISDEPTAEQLEDYQKSKAIVSDLLEGYTIMDALSDYDFYKNGVVDTPVAANDHIQPFIDNGAKNLWAYCCCAQCVGVSNRLVAMPSARTRFIGTQLFKYNIEGFLHWGYNFYYSQHSRELIDPFIDLSGDRWVPAGDTHSVYPGRNGEPIESIRFAVFRHALEDLRAMQLAESLYSHDEVISAIEEALGYTVVFDKCALTPEEILAIREKINAMIKLQS